MGEFFISPWFWIALAAVLSLVEFTTFNLATIWFALAALLTALVAGICGSSIDFFVLLKIELALFFAASIIMLIFTRPIAVKKFKVGKVKTNVDDLIGREARVITTIPPHDKGEVKINGLVWSAITEDASELQKDSLCKIIRIEGVKLIVNKID